MLDPLIIAKTNDNELALLPAMSNRHGCITGATGTGKTVTLQKLAESFSSIGVPVFMADVKGDLSGISRPGTPSEKMKKRLDMLQIDTPIWQGYPVTLWDVLQENGHPVRATISDMGPLLLSQLLSLNETQEGVLALAFKIADDNGLLLLDLKDLRALLQFIGDNAAEFKTQYGNVSSASIGAIQRGLLQIEQQGGDKFFGEPMLNIEDLMQTIDGKGVINILTADKLLNSPKLYSTFLLWMLSELYENLPETGDREQPKLIFFFDEAHLLFSTATPALLEKIEQVVRLIRSKSIGIYFVTQNPLDIPEKILGQLGNRIQHALRAFTPRDQKAVATIAETMRPNPGFDIKQAITELSVGEALISFLDTNGSPSITQRAFIFPPTSQIGPITPDERKQLIESSLVAGAYEQAVDRESAFEMLQARIGSTNHPEKSSEKNFPSNQESNGSVGQQVAEGILGGLGSLVFGSTGKRGGHRDGMISAFAKSAARSVGTSVAREITRGLLGSLLGSTNTKRRR
ncbi:ATP-binding protein [Nitrosomonas sp. PY1]|uniref:helicase HerA-like domain-containing protein n=1 Tax=Nitrosomonas sp. PY1 TaxID=1803906 RepID=UPI001FC8AC04|nr:helicase HerA-like domain-containing protein [Nitrosomonas sp. PY1]GKS69531.1 ATP-binding protein [Nitrosomonas sp. PY1]